MSEVIYTHRLPKSRSNTQLQVSAVAYEIVPARHKIELDNIAFRLNDDNMTHYEAHTANISIDADHLPALIEALQAAQSAIEHKKQLQT